MYVMLLSTVGRVQAGATRLDPSRDACAVAKNAWGGGATKSPIHLNSARGRRARDPRENDESDSGITMCGSG